MTLVPMCQNCKLWIVSDSKWLNRGCSSEKFIGGYGLDFVDQGGDVPLDGVRLESDEGWEIKTGPEFSCIHHEPKEQA